MRFNTYDPEHFYDELFIEKGQPRPAVTPLTARIDSLPEGELQQRQLAAQNALFKSGVTFNISNDTQGQERIFPLDITPRIVPAQEWSRLEQGLKQRVQALNHFLADIYNHQKILKDKIIPQAVVESADGYLEPCLGLQPPRGVWCHITGSDLVRDRDGQWYVLEDNLRIPSGISYLLENRRVMKSIFPELFRTMAIQPVDHYASHLLDTLLYLVPDSVPDPTVVVLTSGRICTA